MRPDKLHNCGDNSLTKTSTSTESTADSFCLANVLNHTQVGDPGREKRAHTEREREKVKISSAKGTKIDLENRKGGNTQQHNRQPVTGHMSNFDDARAQRAGQ